MTKSLLTSLRLLLHPTLTSPYTNLHHLRISMLHTPLQKRSFSPWIPLMTHTDSLKQHSWHPKINLRAPRLRTLQPNSQTYIRSFRSTHRHNGQTRGAQPTYIRQSSFLYWQISSHFGRSISSAATDITTLTPMPSPSGKMSKLAAAHKQMQTDRRPFWKV